MFGPPIGRIACGKLSDILLPFLRSFAIRLKECLDGCRIVGIEFDERFLGNARGLCIRIWLDALGLCRGFLGRHRLRIKPYRADGQNREFSPPQKDPPQ
jgi:hypothetical protein